MRLLFFCLILFFYIHLMYIKILIGLPRDRIFLFFVITERIRKGGDLRKKSGGHHASNKNNAATISTKFCRFLLGAHA